MLEINMSNLAKKVARKGEDWLMYVDTYGQIPEEKIEEMDKAGFDLIQIAENNSHVGWEWEKR